MKKCVALEGGARGAWWGVVGVLAMSLGCSAGKTTIPALTGPSTFGTSVRLLVSPDIMYADGQSTSTVLVQVFDSNGKPAPNRTVFLLTGDRNAQPLKIGQLSTSQVVTGPDGTATARYTAPPAQTFSADENVTVLGRVATINGSSLDQTWEWARIELVAIDRRTLPPNSVHPTCSMMSDPRYGPWYTNVPINFMTTSGPAAGTYIIQYLWRFGDDETKYYYGPDQTHVFTAPGNYSIFQSVLDNTGGVDSCLFSHHGNSYMTVENP
jgi:hypothetical protein